LSIRELAPDSASPIEAGRPLASTPVLKWSARGRVPLSPSSLNPLRFSAPPAPLPGPQPRRPLPRGARRTRGRVLHPARKERGPPALLVVAGDLEVRSPGAPCRQRLVGCQTASRAMCGGREGSGHRTGEGDRRSRGLLAGVVRVGRARTTR